MFGANVIYHARIILSDKLRKYSPSSHFVLSASLEVFSTLMALDFIVPYKPNPYGESEDYLKRQSRARCLDRSKGFYAWQRLCGILTELQFNGFARTIKNNGRQRGTYVFHKFHGESPDWQIVCNTQSYFYVIVGPLKAYICRRPSPVWFVFISDQDYS